MAHLTRFGRQSLRTAGHARSVPTARCASSDAPERVTLLHAEHKAAGGQMVDFAGFDMPLQYKGDSDLVKDASSIKESTIWTRKHASLFDVSHMCSVKWTGKDAEAFLEYVTVADIKNLPMNASTLSVITNEQGGAIDDTMITRCSDHIYQVINAGCATKDLEHFDEQLGKFGGDVHLEIGWEKSRGLYALQGPEAHNVLQRLVGDQLSIPTIPFGGAFTANVAGAPCFITRCGYTGEDGFEINCPGDAALDVWHALTGNSEVRLAGLGARDMLRMEAGLCLYGNELNESITPPEAGLTWTVGAARRVEGAAPFLGSDIILAQIKDRSLIRRLRCGLLPEGPPARTGAVITSTEKEPIGVVTSGCSSPCLGRNIAIGFVEKPFNKKGTEVLVQTRKKYHRALTAPMPFVPTSYYKL
eukprot:m.80713 g.80713  ORF g.80713 m.80713 type:complete len:416 (-) comp16310_c0_seq1:294-1541(-)